MSNKIYYVSYSEGDSVYQESLVIMAVAKNMKKSERLFLDFFKKEKLPAFTYHTARKIISGNVLRRLLPASVKFFHTDSMAQEEWKKIRRQIDQTRLDKEIIKIIYHRHEVVS